MIVTTYLVKCPCGHTGQIKLKENDTPYSLSTRESYSLIDLEGETYSTTSTIGWEKVFAHLKPSCPKCGTKLNPQHLHTQGK